MTPTEARTEFLRRLSNDDCIPAEVDVATTARVAGVELPHGYTSSCETLANAVETFATEFWSLSIAERHVRWNALQSERHLASAGERLRELKRGLDVSKTTHPDPAVERVAAAIRDGFILSPRARAVARARLLDQQSPELIAATKCLSTDLPELAALDPLGVQLWAGDPPENLIPQGENDLFVEPSSFKHHNWSQDAPQAKDWENATAKVKSARESKRDSGDKSTIPFWIIAMILLGVLRACISLSSKSNTPYSPPPHYYSPPTRSSPPTVPLKDSPLFNITPEELLEIALYDPKSGKPPPPKYALSRLIGFTDKDLKSLREKHQAVLDASKKVQQLKEELELKRKAEKDAPPTPDKR